MKTPSPLSLPDILPAAFRVLGLCLAVTGCAPPVQVADGERMIVGRTHVQLWGIEAPDLHQTCAGNWPAGAEARRTLEDLIGHRRVVCEARGLDRYRRVLGLCRVDGKDIAAAMVSAGMAWADVSATRAYVGVEADARAAGRGLHGHDCIPPSEIKTVED